MFDGLDQSDQKTDLKTGKTDLSSLSNEELKELHAQTIKDVTKFSNFQQARKICLNSLYGALGNQYFRHYKLENAEAITLTGQVAIRWMKENLTSI